MTGGTCCCADADDGAITSAVMSATRNSHQRSCLRINCISFGSKALLPRTRTTTAVSPPRDQSPNALAHTFDLLQEWGNIIVASRPSRVKCANSGPCHHPPRGDYAVW